MIKGYCFECRKSVTNKEFESWCKRLHHFIYHGEINELV